MRRGTPNLFKDGTEHLSGLEQAVIKNCRACKELTELTRTSYGPNGLNKLIVNHLGKIFCTSDAATIMKEMEINHPAAKMVVLAAGMQEAEVGDGSNYVVVLAGELLHQAESLLRMGLHPSEAVSGYEKASKAAQEILSSLAVWKCETKDLYDRDTLIKGVRASVMSKQYGYVEFLAPLIADACLSVMPKNPQAFNVDNVRVVKILGSQIHQSEMIKGMVIAHDTQNGLKKVKDAKIAVYTCSLQAADTETKGTVLIHNADELMNLNSSEEKEIEKIIKSIADAGVNVIVTGSTIDDMAAHFIEKYGMMVLKVVSKFDLRRLCKATGAHAMVNLEKPEPESIGFCSNVFVKEYGLTKVTVFQQDKLDASQVATIVLRSSTHNILNDLERAIDDGVNTVRAMTRDARFVTGAGAAEIEISRQLYALAAKSPGLEQYSIKKFAEALEVIPKTLAENSGQTAIDVISQLYAAHERGEAHTGVDVDGGIKDALKDHILDLLPVKLQALRLVTDAVISVLRVDQIIMAKQAGGPKLPQQKANWDED